MFGMILIGLAALLLIFGLAAFSNIRISLEYSHKKKNDQFRITFRILYGLIRYKVDVPMLNFKPDDASIAFEEKTAVDKNQQKENKGEVSVKSLLARFEEMKELLSRIRGLPRIVRQLLSHVNVKQFSWHSCIGTGDAAATGILIGSGWAAKGMIVGILSSFLCFKAAPEYSIQPDYQKAAASTSMFCIFHLRLGHAIVAGIKLFRHFRGSRLKQLKKGMEPLHASSKKI